MSDGQFPRDLNLIESSLLVVVVIVLYLLMMADWEQFRAQLPRGLKLGYL